MYDPKKPATLFEGNNLMQFMEGIVNAQKLRSGLGGDLDREDVGVCMVALSDAERKLQNHG